MRSVQFAAAPFAGDLPYVSVMSAISAASFFVNAFFGARQRQFPTAVEGVFIRASLPSLR